MEENWYLITSESIFDSGSLEIINIINSVDNSKLLFSTPNLYTGSYSQYFESYDAVLVWMYDSTTKEEKNWNKLYVDPDDDPYGIDGPFPEEMDETII